MKMKRSCTMTMSSTDSCGWKAWDRPSDRSLELAHSLPLHVCISFSICWSPVPCAETCISEHEMGWAVNVFGRRARLCGLEVVGISTNPVVRRFTSVV